MVAGTGLPGEVAELGQVRDVTAHKHWSIGRISRLILTS